MVSQPLYADIYRDITGAPFKVKGDTTIYTADSFNVSANANVEEKKLKKIRPGTTDQKADEGLVQLRRS